MACGLSPVDERVHAWLTLTVASWFLVSGAAAAAAAAGGRAPGSLLGWLAHCHRLLLSPVHVFARPPACAPICGPNAAPTTPILTTPGSEILAVAVPSRYVRPRHPPERQRTRRWDSEELIP